MKRVLTVFLCIIFLISSLTMPVLATDDIVIGEITDEGSQEVELAPVEDEQQNDDADGNIIIEQEDLIPDDDQTSENEQINQEENVDLYGEGWDYSDDVIDLFALGSGYYDSESFEANPKVFKEDFEGEFNVSSLGVDIDVSGQINYREDIAVIKGSEAKYGDADGEVGINDATTESQDGSFVMWTNRQTDAESIFKFFDVFNRDGLTHADKNDKYALRFKLFIPRVDGLTRDKVQIKLGTYSPMLYNENGTYPSATPTAYTTAAKQENTFIVPTGEWVDVFWDNNGAGLVPGQLIVNQLGISSRMAFTTLYIDDLTVVRTEKTSTYSVDASDMQPLDSSNYVKTSVSYDADEELGTVLKVAPGGSLKFSPSSYAKRFIADEGGLYKINFKTKNASNLKVEGISAYIDRSKLEGADYKTINKVDFADVYSLSDDAAYSETVIMYSEEGVKDSVLFGGKNADIFRAINFVNESADQDVYIYDITVSKINKFSPLSAFNAYHDNWGWKESKTNSPNFVYNEGKLNINAVIDGSAQKIKSTVALYEGAEYQVNFKAMSTDGETLVIKVYESGTNNLIYEVSQVLTGVEKEYCQSFKIDGNYEDNVMLDAYVEMSTTDKAITLFDLKLSLINDVIKLDTSDENSILVTGDLSDYTVSAPKAYLLLGSFDYTDTSALKAEADVVLNPDRTYEVLFDGTGDIFSEYYYNDINVVLVGIDGIPYVAKSVHYESAKIKANLIRAIAIADNANVIAEIIRGKSGLDEISNDVILELDDLDFYIASKSIIEDLSEIIYLNKDKVLNEDNNADALLLHEEYLFAATLAGTNTKKLSNQALVQFIDRIKERIDVEDEVVYQNLYTGLSDDDKKAVMVVFKDYAASDNCTDEATYKTTFIDSIFKYTLNTCVTYTDVMTYVTNYKNFIGITDEQWSEYTDLAGGKYYTEAQKQISKYAKSTKDIHSIGNNISECITDAKDIVDDKDDNVSGPSNGPSSKDKTYTPPVNFEIKVENKPVTHSFIDLAGYEWAEENINSLVANGAVNGYEDNTFRPANLITRTEFAKILSVAFDVYNENATCDYTDVAAGFWGNSYIASLVDLGVVKGMPDGSYGINSQITRQDVAVLVYRLAQAKGIKLEKINPAPDFADDSSISSYAKEAVSQLYQAGVISGMGDNTFNPQGYANRAQAAKIIAFFVK